MATCEKCKSWFDAGGERWKRLCLQCWKKKKRAEQTAFYGFTDQNADADYWRGRCIRAENRLCELEGANPSDAILDGLRDHLKTLVFCCHPDRNGGSDRATAATKFLLSLRELLT